MSDALQLAVSVAYGALTMLGAWLLGRWTARRHFRPHWMILVCTGYGFAAGSVVWIVAFASAFGSELGYLIGVALGIMFVVLQWRRADREYAARHEQMMIDVADQFDLQLGLRPLRNGLVRLTDAETAERLGACMICSEDFEVGCELVCMHHEDDDPESVWSALPFFAASGQEIVFCHRACAEEHAERVPWGDS